VILEGDSLLAGATCTLDRGIRAVLSFGPFRLVASERLLTRDGEPVKVSARVLDILIALSARPNEAVGKNDLLARVWPDVTVKEGSLRFHVAGLRKALGDGKDGARCIETSSGRGCCFVAPVVRSSDRLEAKVPPASFPQGNLPAHRRLPQPQHHCRRAEARHLRHGDERPPMMQLHGLRLACAAQPEVHLREWRSALRAAATSSPSRLDQA